MKNLVLFLALTCLGLVSAQAQTVSGCNEAVINASIQANAGQGWALQSKEFTSINYLVQPDAPYITGFWIVTYTPDCEPLEPCPRILKAERFDAIIVNENGNCVVKRGDF